LTRDPGGRPRTRSATAAGVAAWGFNSITTYSGTVVSPSEGLLLIFAANACYLIPLIAVASIGVLRAFNEIFILTNGGPLDTTRTVTLLLFKTFFQQGQLGLGSAMGVLLTLIILAFTLFQFRILGRRVEYG